MRGARVLAVAAGLATVAVGAAWYRRRRARAQLMAAQPKAAPPPGSCCAEEAAIGGNMRAPLEPLSAQLVLHLRARLASPSPSPSTSTSPSTSASAATPAGDDDALHLCGVSEAWLVAAHRLVRSGAYATEGSNLAALCYSPHTPGSPATRTLRTRLVLTSDRPGDSWRVDLIAACAEEAQAMRSPSPRLRLSLRPSPRLRLSLRLRPSPRLRLEQACLRGVWAAMGARLLASMRAGATNPRGGPNPNPNPDPNPNSDPNPNYNPNPNT